MLKKIRDMAQAGKEVIQLSMVLSQLLSKRMSTSDRSSDVSNLISSQTPRHTKCSFPEHILLLYHAHVFPPHRMPN